MGTGVLFFDPNSTGQITQKNQFVFTEWDKIAKSDLEALLNVFDSNGYSKFDASDAKFNLFKVMVTNADGRKISVEKTFTKSDGSIGRDCRESCA